MTLRVTASLVTFAASQTDTEVISPVLLLTDYVSSNVSLRPMALTFADPSAFPTDLLVSQVVLRSTKNPTEVAQRLYMGPKVPLAAVMGAFNRDALKNVPLTLLRFMADHGMELVFTYDNGTTALTAAVILWDIANQKFGGFGPVPGGVFDAIEKAGFNHVPGGAGSSLELAFKGSQPAREAAFNRAPFNDLDPSKPQ